jgi:hypothetical protein
MKTHDEVTLLRSPRIDDDEELKTDFVKVAYICGLNLM